MFIRLLLLVALMHFSLILHAGELYSKLARMSDRKIMTTLFEKVEFNHEDALDLDQLWEERKFTESFVIRSFERYRKKHPTEANAYQEVILWHTTYDVIPYDTTPETFNDIAMLFHDKANLFNGTVRMIGGFLDNGDPYRKGICRWISPNTFLMLYVVRQAREPYLGPYFPMDGGTLVSQVMH